MANKVLFVAIALAIAGWWAYGKFQDSKVASAHEHRKQQSQDAVVAASKRYNAIIDWEEKLTQPNAFSVQIQDALIPEDGKPIAIEGFVEDITRRDGQYYLSVTAWNTANVSIQFVLECDAMTAKRVIEKNGSFKSIGLIARITSVEKAQLELKSGPKTSEDSAPVEMDSSSLFIARGKCLEVISSDN